MTMTLPPRRFARPKPPGPQPMHWTCEEFHRLGDLGVFEGRHAMLIDGVILEEGPMNPPHAVTLELVETAVRTAFGAGWRVRNQSPLVFGLDVDPEPDLAVIAGSPRDVANHPTTADLVIEVADTSLAFDTDDKRRLYAQAGIREYWVVDVNGRKLIVYREPKNGDFASTVIFDAAAVVSPLANPTAEVRVAELFL